MSEKSNIDTIADGLSEKALETDNPKVAERLLKLGLDELIELDLEVPTILRPGQEPLPKEESRRLLSEHKDRFMLANLTSSLFLSTHTEPPSGRAIKKETCARICRQLGLDVHKKKGVYFINVEPDSDIEVIIKDTNEWLAMMRALHFLLTRHDPDSERIYVQYHMMEAARMGPSISDIKQ